MPTQPRKRTTTRATSAEPSLNRLAVTEAEGEGFEVVYIDKISVEPAKPIAIAYEGRVIRTRSPQSMAWDELQAVDFGNSVAVVEALVTNQDVLSGLQLAEVNEIGRRIFAAYETAGSPSSGESNASS